jgi:N-acetylneuraminate synthase
MTIKIRNFELKDYSAPYIIAEIGANHNGDMDLAKEMILSAKKCGAHAAKFQSWTPSSLISNEEYQKNQKYDDNPKKHWGSLKDMVTRYYLKEEQHKELRDFCIKNEIDFCSTPFSVKEADLLEDLNVPFFKIASMDVNNLRLLRHVASYKKPILISTGMATLGEIETAIETMVKAGNEQIVLLHCISIYPPLHKDINLNNIISLRKAFGFPVGFSDHSIGYSIPLASVSLGSCVIEKHFTTDKNLPGWDHEISADPIELEIICRESININASMGTFKRVISEAEMEKRKKFRRSIVINKDLAKGSILKDSDLDFKRPGTGISPDLASSIIGRKLKQSLRSDEILKLSDLE